jgi:hypothetical protein
VKWELLVVPRILLGRARERELRHLQEFTPQSTWVVFVRFTSTLSVLELSEMSACRKGTKLSRTLHLMRKRHFLRINRIPRKIILSVDFGSGRYSYCGSRRTVGEMPRFLDVGYPVAPPMSREISECRLGGCLSD